MTAIFSGSFDPVTIGHIDIIRRFFEIWPQERLIVAVSENPGKSGFFLIEQRLEQVARAVKEFPRATVERAQGLIAQFAKTHNASFIIRGIRDDADAHMELAHARHNRILSGIETVFIPSSPEHSIVSSTAVRNIAVAGGDASWMLPECVRCDIVLSKQR
ncbi:MAG: pantetheine-phosphate adenylyltransferase [Clostridiales bacterium]|nr:pantetheine-phosphate adenylyltransferase [Clostridiales bacterium]